jgi:hypothetical protein
MIAHVPSARPAPLHSVATYLPCCDYFWWFAGTAVLELFGREDERQAEPGPVGRGLDCPHHRCGKSDRPRHARPSSPFDTPIEAAHGQTAILPPCPPPLRDWPPTRRGGCVSTSPAHSYEQPSPSDPLRAASRRRPPADMPRSRRISARAWCRQTRPLGAPSTPRTPRT